MEHAKKFALVDPRLVETLLAHQPTKTTTHVLTKLDADMKTILDRTDLQERESVAVQSAVRSIQYHRRATEAATGTCVYG